MTAMEIIKAIPTINLNHNHLLPSEQVKSAHQVIEAAES